MATESTAGGTTEPANEGQAQQRANGSEQQARSAGGPPQQQRGEREASRGISRRAGYEPDALAISALGANPFSFMRRMMDDLDRLFDEFGFRGRQVSSMDRREMGRRSASREAFWAPDVDVFEREGALVVRADLPGLSKDDVRVEVQDGALVIEGERRQEREVERSGTYRAERIHGAFSRAIPLPESADADNAEAHFENGVLEVSIPMSQEKGRGKRIEIQEGKQESMH